MPRGIVIDAECDEAIFFRGERQDLEEMLGNLIDNACKWAQAGCGCAAARPTGRLIVDGGG